MGRIVTVHFPDLKGEVVRACVETFFRLRGIDGIEKKPATRELLNWIRALRADPGFTVSGLQKGDVPYLGVLYKKSPDLAIAARKASQVMR